MSLDGMENLVKHIEERLAAHQQESQKPIPTILAVFSHESLIDENGHCEACQGPCLQSAQAGNTVKTLWDRALKTRYENNPDDAA